MFMKKLASFLSHLTIAMVILSFATVVLRYAFNVVIIPMQELILYLHAITFMLGIMYCFTKNRHVRIDVFHQKFSQSTQARVNMAGLLLLLIPMFAFMAYASFDYVQSSWLRFEGSAETGGLPFVYGLKTLLLIMPLGMIALALSRLIKKS